MGQQASALRPPTFSVGTRHLSSTHIQEYAQWDTDAVIRAFVKCGLASNPDTARAVEDVLCASGETLRAMRESIRGKQHLSLTRLAFISVFNDLSSISDGARSLDGESTPGMLALSIDQFRCYQKRVLHPGDVRPPDALGTTTSGRPDGGKPRGPGYANPTVGWRARTQSSGDGSRSTLRRTDSGASVGSQTSDRPVLSQTLNKTKDLAATAPPRSSDDGVAVSIAAPHVQPAAPYEVINGVDVVLVLALLCQAVLDDRLAFLFDIFDGSGKGSLTNVRAMAGGGA